MNIGFIGGGVMAEALISGIVSAGVMLPGNIIVSELKPERRKYLADKYSVNVSGDNLQAINNNDIIILAIKPNDLPNLYNNVAGTFGPDQSVMSIVAGVTMQSLMRGLQHHEIIRVMPNTPAQIGKGMSVWTCTKIINHHRFTTGKILSTIGDEIYVDDEKYLDMATAVSGSGPAYVFTIVESLIDAGVYIGLSRDVARRLVLQTIRGSVELIAETNQHPGVLKDMVMSPGGTTAEGLQVLERSGVHAALVDSVNAAYMKSKSLGSGSK